MIIRKERKFIVRMAEYETYTFGADVTVGPEDLGYTPEAVAQLTDDEHEELLNAQVDLLETTLMELVRRDIEESASLTPSRKSYIRSIFLDEPQSPEPPAPAPKSQRAKVRKISGRS